MRRGPRRSPSQREGDRSRVASLHLAGKSQWDIASLIGVSRTQVEYDLRIIKLRWKQESAATINEHQNRLLAENRQLRRELWDAWHNSDADKQVTVTKQRRRALNTSATEMPMDQTSEASKRSESRNRNPAYAQPILASLDLEARILGIARPTPLEVHPVIREIHYDSAPHSPDQGRLTIIGSNRPELPEPAESDASA
jgi:hypothetical protein